MRGSYRICQNIQKGILKSLYDPSAQVYFVFLLELSDFWKRSFVHFLFKMKCFVILFCFKRLLRHNFLFEKKSLCHHSLLNKKIPFVITIIANYSSNVLLIHTAAPDLGSAKGPGKGCPTTFMYLAICTTCACHLVIFISEDSLFADAIKLSVVQTAVFHLKNIWYCDETAITLIVFPKVGQPRRTH